MLVTEVNLRNVAGTEAAMGWAGSHTIVVDRPEGTAGGGGLGFNGGQLLALAIGGCFCNDLRYVSHQMRVPLASIAVRVALTLEGMPLVATGAEMAVACETEDASDAGPVIERAKESCMVSNSLKRGIDVKIVCEG